MQCPPSSLARKVLANSGVPNQSSTHLWLQPRAKREKEEVVSDAESRIGSPRYVIHFYCPTFYVSVSTTILHKFFWGDTYVHSGF